MQVAMQSTALAPLQCQSQSRCMISRGVRVPALGHFSPAILGKRSVLVRHTAPRRLWKSRYVQASASGTESEDPYKVLGLSRNADSEAINRTYKRLVRENKDDDAAKARIETAHSAIMMSQLNARMKGKLDVGKDVKYADKAVYFPWRPRLHKAEKNLVLYTAVAHAVLAAWGLLLTSTAGTQPIVASAVVGAGANIYKLQQIFPPGPSSSDSGNNSVLKNLLRGAALAMLATFLGCFVLFTFPDWVAAQLNRSLPYWFYEREQAILAVGTALANWIMSSFYR